MDSHRPRLIFGLVVVLSLGCSWLTGASPEASTPAEESATGGGDAAEGPDMIDQTISLRSVRLSLTATYPDGEERSLSGEIDAAGNMRLVEPLDPGPNLRSTLTPPEEGWGEFEVIIVGGHAYVHRTGEPPAEDDSYLDALARELRGPEGPGLWLGWAGTENLEPAGHEEVGGFSAIRYPVQADLGDGSVDGTIWVDEETSALVRAELTISPALFSTAQNLASGDLTIVFEAVQADITPISIP
jgi:hypothetical protein